jgi:hypothetical protein
VKTIFKIRRDELRPPVKSRELATFTWLLQQPSGIGVLNAFGISVPEVFEITQHSNPDDPPDLSAFGYGFEVTEFPPNQSAIQAVYKERGGKAMAIPAFQRTGRDIARIRAEIGDLASPTNSLITGGFSSVPAEVLALEREFFGLLHGPESKDVPGNDILLLDQRYEHFTDFSLAPAIKNATSKMKPVHIKLIIMVRARESIQAYP